jgi:CDP-diacylglycerol--glycerol-3-phosphate 3-phosphatidyltransferase
MIWNVPNTLTFGRLFAALIFPFVYVMLPHPYSDAVALLLFTIAALTDFLDGWLARRWEQTTAIGRLLDPIADKAMVAVALLALCGLYGASWVVLIPAAVILVREFAVSALREMLADKRIVMPSSLLAKWKTTIQMTAISVLLLAVYLNFAGYQTKCIVCGRPALGLVDLFGLGLLWLGAVMTAITGWQYFARSMDTVLGENG